MTDLKFRTPTEELSTAIQKRLFELGIEWVDGKVLSYTGSPYLVIDNGVIKCGHRIDVYMHSSEKEATLNDLYDEEFIKKHLTKEPEYKEGDWVIVDGGSISKLGTLSDDRFIGSIFFGTSYSTYGYLNHKEYILSKYIERKATEKEVKEALIKEAKRRFGGDWKNMKIKGHAHNGTQSFNYNNLTVGYHFLDDNLWNINGCIYSQGTWAEPLEQEKPIMICGHEAKYNDGFEPIGDFYKICCVRLTKSDIKTIYKHRNNIEWDEVKRLIDSF